MNLTTHFFFSLAVGFLFFGQPAIAFLVALGALLPDLDREYWFMPSKEYRDEQFHRALFHNVFLMGGIFLLSPFVSIGMFLHVFQDSFTTVKDRGCEWLYPITRLVKRGRKNANGDDELPSPKEGVYFYQEDPKGLLENADPDLREVGDRPVPWRRSYGPALNGQLLDQGFLLGSIIVIVAWAILPSANNIGHLSAFFAEDWGPFVIGFASIGLVYAAGELDRRDRIKPIRVPMLSFLKGPLLAIGIALAGYGIFLVRLQVLTKVEVVSSYWWEALATISIIFLVSTGLIKIHTRSEKTATV